MFSKYFSNFVLCFRLFFLTFWAPGPRGPRNPFRDFLRTLGRKALMTTVNGQRYRKAIAHTKNICYGEKIRNDLSKPLCGSRLKLKPCSQPHFPHFLRFCVRIFRIFRIFALRNSSDPYYDGVDLWSFLLVFDRFRPVLVKNGQNRLEIGSF